MGSPVEKFAELKMLQQHISQYLLMTPDVHTKVLANERGRRAQRCDRPCPEYLSTVQGSLAGPSADPACLLRPIESTIFYEPLHPSNAVLCASSHSLSTNADYNVPHGMVLGGLPAAGHFTLAREDGTLFVHRSLTFKV